MKVTVRTKPVLLEAEQWVPNNAILGVKKFVRDDGSVVGVVPGIWGGETHMRYGDWIVRHPNGEQFVVSGEYFHDKYEIVVDEII